ncbi:MAG: PEP-CTERM sorting domain-containing protein [Gammaproteobacteria bacterium]
MKLTNVLAAMLGVLALLATVPASALIVPNAALYDGSPGFSLVGSPDVPNPGSPGVQLLTGFNAQSPTTSGLPTLDLGNAGDPLINNPDSGSTFSIFWGMELPAVQFNLPADANGALYPPSPCLSGSFCYNFNASDGTNSYQVSFVITGPAGAEISNWTAITNWPVLDLLDLASPDLPAVQFNFDLTSSTLLVAADPQLSFSVTENQQPLRFSVPEPATVFLMAAGIMGLVVRRRAPALCAP